MTTTNDPVNIDDSPEVNIDDTLAILGLNMADTPCVEIFEALEELFGMKEPEED